MPHNRWVILVYKIPTEPTKYRAAVWREIKRLGGVYLQNGVCIFPDIDDVALNVSSLASQIRNMSGTEYLFYTTSPTQEQALELIHQFQVSRNEEYEILLNESDVLQNQCAGASNDVEFANLHDEFRRLQKQVGSIKGRDYFVAPLGIVMANKLREIRVMITSLNKER